MDDLKVFFERHKEDVLWTIVLFVYCGFWIVVGSSLGLSDDLVNVLVVLFFMAAVAVYLRFRKNSSEQDKTLSAGLILAIVVAPFFFLFHYLIDRM